MIVEDLREAEESVLSMLRDSDKTPITVIGDLTRQGLREDAVRTAIWDLIDRGEVELTSQQQLHVRNTH